MIRPTGKTVLLKVDSLEDADPMYKAAKAAGLHIPEGAEKTREQRSVDRATVVSISDMAWKDWFDGTPWCKVGDRVLIAKYAGKVVKEGDKEFTLINDEDVLGVLE
jgi:co-chaperonin GroES (HSP10)